MSTPRSRLSERHVRYPVLSFHGLDPFGPTLKDDVGRGGLQEASQKEPYHKTRTKRQDPYPGPGLWGRGGDTGTGDFEV